MSNNPTTVKIPTLTPTRPPTTTHIKPPWTTKSWKCVPCEYVNRPEAKECEMCTVRRPNPPTEKQIQLIDDDTNMVDVKHTPPTTPAKSKPSATCAVCFYDGAINLLQCDKCMKHYHSPECDEMRSFPMDHRLTPLRLCQRCIKGPKETTTTPIKPTPPAAASNKSNTVPLPTATSKPGTIPTASAHLPIATGTTAQPATKPPSTPAATSPFKAALASPPHKQPPQSKPQVAVHFSDTDMQIESAGNVTPSDHSEAVRSPAASPTFSASLIALSNSSADPAVKRENELRVLRERGFDEPHQITERELKKCVPQERAIIRAYCVIVECRDKVLKRSYDDRAAKDPSIHRTSVLAPSLASLVTFFSCSCKQVGFQAKRRTYEHILKKHTEEFNLKHPGAVQAEIQRAKEQGTDNVKPDDPDTDSTESTSHTQSHGTSTSAVPSSSTAAAATAPHPPLNPSLDALVKASAQASPVVETGSAVAGSALPTSATLHFPVTSSSSALCKKCHKNSREIVNLPCMDMALCGACHEESDKIGLRTCFTCKQPINGSIAIGQSSEKGEQKLFKEDPVATSSASNEEPQLNQQQFDRLRPRLAEKTINLLTLEPRHISWDNFVRLKNEVLRVSDTLLGKDQQLQHVARQYVSTHAQLDSWKGRFQTLSNSPEGAWEEYVKLKSKYEGLCALQEDLEKVNIKMKAVMGVGLNGQPAVMSKQPPAMPVPILPPLTSDTPSSAVKPLVPSTTGPAEVRLSLVPRTEPWCIVFSRSHREDFYELSRLQPHTLWLDRALNDNPHWQRISDIFEFDASEKETIEIVKQCVAYMKTQGITLNPTYDGRESRWVFDQPQQLSSLVDQLTKVIGTRLLTAGITRLRVRRNLKVDLPCSGCHTSMGRYGKIHRCKRCRDSGIDPFDLCGSCYSALPCTIREDHIASHGSDHNQYELSGRRGNILHGQVHEYSLSGTVLKQESSASMTPSTTLSRTSPSSSSPHQTSSVSTSAVDPNAMVEVIPSIFVSKQPPSTVPPATTIAAPSNTSTTSATTYRPTNIGPLKTRVPNTYSGPKTFGSKTAPATKPLVTSNSSSIPPLTDTQLHVASNMGDKLKELDAFHKAAQIGLRVAQRLADRPDLPPSIALANAPAWTAPYLEPDGSTPAPDNQPVAGTKRPASDVYVSHTNAIQHAVGSQSSMPPPEQSRTKRLKPTPTQPATTTMPPLVR